MKKAIIFILAALTAASLCACGDKEESLGDAKPAETSVTKADKGGSAGELLADIGLVPSMQGYVDKSKKATANSEATQIRSAALTAIIEALYKTKDSAAIASCSAGKVIKFSELNDSNPIDAEIKTLIDGNIVLADSMLYFEYDSSRDEITFAQFQKDEKSPIGQSPIPKDNAAVEKLGVMQE